MSIRVGVLGSRRPSGVKKNIVLRKEGGIQLIFRRMINVSTTLIYYIKLIGVREERLWDAYRSLSEGQLLLVTLKKAWFLYIMGVLEQPNSQNFINGS